MPEATIAAKARVGKKKQASKQLRREGLVPGVLYGRGEEPSLLTINTKELLVLLHSFGRNAVVDLKIEGKKTAVKAFIYEIQHDPLSGDIIHVDFKHISLTEKINITVPVRLEGVPEGVKNEGGILEHVMHTLNISCLPTEIPSQITIDVSDLKLGGIIHVRDIPVENFEILDEQERTLVHVVAPKIIKATEEEEGAEEIMGLGEAEEPEVIGEEGRDQED